MGFEEDLKKIFIDEVTQVLQDTEQCFLDLEKNSSDIQLLDKIFRLAHNLKGGAKAVGFDQLGEFAHEFENFLLRIKKKELVVEPATVDVLLKCNDQITMMVNKLRLDLEAKFDNSALLGELQRFAQKQTDQTLLQVAAQFPDEPIEFNPEAFAATEPPQAQTPPPPPPPSAAAALALAPQQQPLAPQQQPLAPKPAAPPAPTPAPAKSSPAAAVDESIRVSLGRLDKLVNYIGEMVILQSVLNEQSLGNNPLLLRRTIQEMGKITKEVQEMAMSLRMIPLKQTFQKLQRIARDTSNALGKKLELHIVGEETEVDKTVLENLSDPLVHIVRNAVDHGLETPAERLSKGKPEIGQLTFKAYHQGGRLVIEVKDDGSGIDPDRLIQKAKEKGVIPANAVLTKQEGIHLIFHPGFSSKAEVTEISGRGVGMDVVRSNIERMNGEVNVETEVNKGSTFKIGLPLTLAIIEGMVIQSGASRFVVPLAHISESVRTRPEDVKMTTGAGPLLLLRGENIPLLSLHQLLRKPGKPELEEIALIVRLPAGPVAIAVDDILSQQQIVIKKLGMELDHLTGFSGSSVLGDGRPALILELSDLIAQMQKGSQSNGQKRGRISA